MAMGTPVVCYIRDDLEKFSKDLPIFKANKLNLARNHVFTKGNKVQEQDYRKYARDVQAILVNPPWDCSNPMLGYESNTSKGSNQSCKKNSDQRISIRDFCEHFVIPKEVMKDGLLFIWVEKEIISQIIKHLESQDFYYVENVCYVMLDQNMK